MEGETEIHRLQSKLDNTVALLNMTRERHIEENAFGVMLQVAGINQCKKCRRALTRSTEGDAPGEPCKRCVSTKK